MVPTQNPAVRPKSSPTPARLKKCSGPCGRTLPPSQFLPDRTRKSGSRSDCKDCYRARRGPRGKLGQQAQALERALLNLQSEYTVPALADVLTRALAEVQQIGKGGPSYAEQVRAVRRAIFTQGCTSIEEMMEDTGLSRWIVDRVVKELVEGGDVEPRTPYLLADEAEEPGRPTTEYHPADSPRGEDFTHRLYDAAEDNLL